MKYAIQYTLPYEHRVMVGIEAESRDEAIARANELFDRGDIWDDTKDVPLLYDDFGETGDDSIAFTVEDEVTGDWPEPDDSVKVIRRKEDALLATRLLIEACRNGEECGGSIDQDKLNRAYQVALRVSGSIVQPNDTRPRKPCDRVAIFLEGGAVKYVVADQPEAAPFVAVVDYDIDGSEPQELRYITNPDGTKTAALIAEHYVEASGISLDEIFRNTK